MTDVHEPAPEPELIEAGSTRAADTALLSTTALALAACGGGGGGSAPPVTATTPPPPTAPVVVKPTRSEAARFLTQATMGFTAADLDQVTSQGYEAWLDAQFAMPRPAKHWDWLVAAGYNAPANLSNQAGFDAVMWRQLIASADQLRQRVGMALLDILVVGIDGISLSWRQFVMAAYVDILWDGAFGNYRQLIERVSLSLAMGDYLTYRNNRKANAQTGAFPDENYAREIMQLFTIGLVKLNPDGSVQMNGAQPAETYTQADITELAKVFTGWTYDSQDGSTPDRVGRPMVNVASHYEIGAKTFLGTTIPAGTGGADALKMALDTLFAHPNVGPFICKQLIQRLVTSNPPPAYVQRVADVFANNGQGVRGDLRAVVRAILLDFEARNPTVAAAPSYGKLREPVRRLTGWARAFGVDSPSNAWAIGDTNSTSTRLGQSPGRSPSVFNFYRPGYTPPNTAISRSNLVAPEFQITSEPSLVAYVNFMTGLIANGIGDVKPNYSVIVARADNPAGLVDEVDLLLGAGLSAETKAIVVGAVNAVPLSATNGPTLRVQTAIALTMAAPEYLVQR